MELINKKHKEFISESNKQSAFITVDTDKSIYISKGAGMLLNIDATKFIHFGREKDRWYLVINTDPSGFNIHDAGKGRYKMCSTALLKLFTRSTKCKVGDSFYVQETESTINDATIAEILTSKTIQQIQKDNK